MGYKEILGRLQIDFGRVAQGRKKQGNPFRGYRLLVERREFDVYRAGGLADKIVGAYCSVVVTLSSRGRNQKIFIFPNYRQRWHRYGVAFTAKKFPGLIPGSKIVECFVIPYMREVTKDVLHRRWRVVVVTDKNQVFHNFPARSVEFEGFEQVGDIVHFEESAIWDLPDRFYPSASSACGPMERYAPHLPESCCEYHPPISARSPFGNEGFPRETTVNYKGEERIVSRFYFPRRELGACSFSYMGGFEPDYKMTLIGTYRANKDCGVRVCVFATSDGGRNWYAKYEFSDEGEYSFRQGSDDWGKNVGNAIIGAALQKSNIANLSFRKRCYCQDEPGKFIWSEPINIGCVSDTTPAVIKSIGAHGLETGNIVALFDDEARVSLRFGCENTRDDYRGMLYKVFVKDDYSFELYECASLAEDGLPCRHIHHINRLRDGWLVGTGEVYPNGWLLYFQMKEADTFSRFGAWDDIEVFRLNSTKDSIQRTVGADLIDSDEPLLVIASDHDLLKRPQISLSGAVSFDRNSTGIYIGKLSDVDCFEKFKVVYEAKEPAFFFKKLANKYVFCGMRGEFAVGSHDCMEWDMADIGQTMFRYRGFTYDFFVIDQYLISLR